MGTLYDATIDADKFKVRYFLQGVLGIKNDKRQSEFLIHNTRISTKAPSEMYLVFDDTSYLHIPYCIIENLEFDFKTNMLIINDRIAIKL